MLNVKSLKFNPFKQKKMKKGGNFEQNFVLYRMNVISGR